MTEEEWLRGPVGSQDMLQSLLNQKKCHRTKAGRRKLRLFGCGCCRLAWNLLADQRLREAVEVTERFVDGKATRSELDAAGERAYALRVSSYAPDAPDAPMKTAILIAGVVAGNRADSAGYYPTALSAGGYRAGELTSDAALCDLVRCVFGNPFRPTIVNPVWLAWHGGTVRQVAESIYEDRSFERLPILADALEDAGCGDQAILDHCRNPGPHARGCWPVDMVLHRG
jgi:hypothetical protein